MIGRNSVKRIDSEPFDDVDAILIPGGFGGRGIEGMIAAVRYARERRIPYLGICLGAQFLAKYLGSSVEKNNLNLCEISNDKFDRL